MGSPKTEFPTQCWGGEGHFLSTYFLSPTLFGKEVGFEVGSDSKVGFLFPTYIFLLINHYMSVSDVGIKRAVRAKLNM
jgi:hypothetical protein